MRIYNSISDKIEEFETVKPNEISMYVCGPTVYDYAHIGNMRPVIFFDVVRRYFEYRGYKVTYASNITDVDDKIINRALKEGRSEKDVVAEFSKAFFEVVDKSGSLRPTIEPHATKYIDQMIKSIQRLIDLGYAYEADGDVYFRVKKVKSYGILSNQSIEDLEAGARIDVEDKKEDPLDFALWKKTDVGIKWDSPWCQGRPGWHTECVVMIDDIFKNRIDIHGGGVDLKFPHHENEIAQCNAVYKDTNIAKYWMHVGRLEFNHEKMSKSLGNIRWAKDLLNDYSYQAVRMMILSSNYRSPINFTNDTMPFFEGEWTKISRALQQAFIKLDLNDAFDDELLEDYINKFNEEMDNDFNTANVFSLVYDLLKKLNVSVRNNQDDLSSVYNTLTKILSVLGIELRLTRMDSDTKCVYKSWEEARKNKNFEKADSLRGELIKRGIM